MMNPRFLYCAPFFIAAILIFIVFLYTCRRLNARGAWYLALVCLAATIWASSEGMLYLDLDYETKIYLTKFQYLGIAPIPPLALLFVLSVFSFKPWTTGIWRFFLIFNAAAIIILVYTNDLHKLVFQEYYLIPTGPFPMLGLRHGSLWWGIVAYHYFLVVVLSVILLRKVLTSTGFQRSQAGVMLAAVISVWIANAVYVSGNSPVLNMDIGPIAFTLVAGSMAWGFFRCNLLDILPIARAEVFHGLEDAILVFDEKNRFVDANPAAESIFKLDVSETIGQEANLVFVQSPELIKIMEEMKQAEARMVRDGRKYIYDVRVSSLNANEGKNLGRVVALRDITKRKRTEELLRESEERYRQIFNIAPAGIYEMDYRTGKLVSVNDAVCEFSGYSREELLSMNPMDLLSEESQERFLGRIERISKGENIAQFAEFTARRKNGSEFLIGINTRFIYEGGEIVGATVVAQDVTERRIAEQAAQAHQERFKIFFSSVNDAIFVHPFQKDGFAPFIEVNDIACQRYGYSRDKFLRLTAADITQKADSRLHASRDHRKELLERKHLVFEAVHIKKSGEEFPVEINSNIVEQFGEPVILAVVRDISGRKLAEAEKNRIENQYRQAQKVEAIGRLAGGVAHDLNNMLSPIIGYSELMMGDFSPDDKRREQIGQIARAGYAARDLVRQLLAFSRKQTLEYKPLNLNKAIEGFEKLLRRTIREDIELEINPSLDIRDIKADIGQVEQVIMNLSVNAQDAMPTGGKLTFDTASIKLSEDYVVEQLGLEPGVYVTLTVSDTGCGMDEGTQEHIFDPFFSTKGEKGTGLGLATVYGIVKQHGGSIRVSSKPGYGTAFELYWPVSGDPSIEKNPSEDAHSELHGTETILLVEDNDAVRNLAQTVLERNGYTLLEAGTGTDALTNLAAYAESVDLLLTDVIMPDMNGRDLFARVAQKHPRIKVLYMSGYTDDVIAHHGVLEDGVQFIQKPFTIQGLAHKVREVLDRD